MVMFQWKICFGYVNWSLFVFHVAVRFFHWRYFLGLTCAMWLWTCFHLALSIFPSSHLCHVAVDLCHFVFGGDHHYTLPAPCGYGLVSFCFLWRWWPALLPTVCHSHLPVCWRFPELCLRCQSPLFAPRQLWNGWEKNRKTFFDFFIPGLGADLGKLGHD